MRSSTASPLNVSPPIPRVPPVPKVPHVALAHRGRGGQPPARTRRHTLSCTTPPRQRPVIPSPSHQNASRQRLAGESGGANSSMLRVTLRKVRAEKGIVQSSLSKSGEIQESTRCLNLPLRHTPAPLLGEQVASGTSSFIGMATGHPKKLAAMRPDEATNSCRSVKIRG